MFRSKLWELFMKMLDSGYTIRSARAEELPLLAQIERSAAALFLDTPYPFLANDEPLSLDFVWQRFQVGQVWVALDLQDVVVGFAITREVDDTIYLQEMDVDPKHGRRGLGSALVETVCDWAQLQDYGTISLSTFRDLPWNAPFYSKLGFRILDESELTICFQQIRLQELEAGLPISDSVSAAFAGRVIMYRELQSPQKTSMFMAIHMEEYLKVSEVIDWQHPAIMELAKQISLEYDDPMSIAKACFEWVRDEIYHSVDYQMNPVTCRASDVLQHKTGYCYAKSHLLAALLRANQIPTGFCYQRLSLDDQGASFGLHGFNAIYLPEFGWYRVDARGNKAGVDAQFMPPQEYLAFKIQLHEEVEFREILPEPLQIVIESLHSQDEWDEMLLHIPDISLESAKSYSLTMTR
jgi:GNAT superfamily N-acetyltransferase